MREVCRELELSDGTVLSWVRDNEDFLKQYARARDIGYDVRFESLREMAAEAPSRIKGFVDQGHVHWQRNRIDVEKWALARQAPKKYGDRLDLNHAGTIEIGLSDRISKARERV